MAETTDRLRQRLPLAVMLVVGMAFCAALLLVTPDQASAYTQTARSGSPGSLTVYKVQGSHYNSCQGLGYECWSPWVTGSTPYVYRSPATNNTQIISLAYALQWWNGSSWVNLANSRTYQRYLYAGYSYVQMPRPDFIPNRSGYFRVRMAVNWATTGGTILGARTLQFDQPGDYRCNTRFSNYCSASGGWVWLRTPGA
jgi:hypothetical protein